MNETQSSSSGEFSRTSADPTVPSQFFSRSRISPTQVKLVCAVLEQAVEDFRRGAFNHEFRRHRVTDHGKTTYPWATAVDWFGSDDQHPFSFWWCCMVVAISSGEPFDHQAVRLQIMGEHLKNEAGQVTPKLVSILGRKIRDEELAAA